MNKQTKYKLALRFFAVLCWMGLIFYFSAQNGTVSSGQSGQTIYKIARLFWPGFAGYDSAAQDAFVQGLQAFVRKTAHFMVYAVLGALLFWAAAAYLAANVRRFLFSTAAGCLYAAFDEMHQYLVPGRSAQLSDICLDTIGAAFGAAVCVGLCLLYQRIKRAKHPPGA